jgi:triosephosphate isomerase (TIM)
MAKSILVANWKNYPGSLDQARTLLKELSKKKDLYKKANLFIASPSVYLETASQKARSFAQLAVQDFPSLPKGTYTGEVTAEMLKNFGVRLAIIGHSERRALGESSKDVSEKIKAAFKAGVAPLICLGEKERDSEGEHFDTLREELKNSLHGVSKNEVKKIALAYEPVWAIGKNATGVITSEELSQTVLFVRKALSDLFGRSAAESVPILYGGSVDHTNAKELIKGSGIRGFLVGRASLNAKSFEGIAKALTEK